MTDLLRRDWMISLAAGMGGALAGCAPRAATAAPPVRPAPPPARPPGGLDQLMAACRGALVTGARNSDGAELVRIGQWCQQQHAVADRYGAGDLVETLEQKIAALLGFEAACFMPTGTMGQLCLLRLYADRSRGRALGVHPSSHHLLHENAAFEVLHGMHEVVLSPWGRALLGDDVRHAQEPLAVVSVELPVRWTGQMQTWAELEDLKAACRERGVPLHVDGARLWEAAPAFGRPLAEVCRGCSSVYVSLYKTIGALGGAVVAGSKELIDGARLWRHRHGGNVAAYFPYAASAAMRIDDVLARIPKWVTRAQQLAARLAKDARFIVAPEVPPTNLFRIYARIDAAEFPKRLEQVARDHKIWVANGAGRARVPGFLDIELQPGADAETITDDEAVAAIQALL
ncbi:beta-eliminating lyase-related protein [Nannocystis sp. ILAH1]|uniref:threonine aldolase family protein n=1 Tax=Nannocystis sp. ILAH1 TaxID=2996789 RepID=UPI002271F572|nr:beta-eliminating lyase-related protein [Nannocystis sp. ILAH1]MCY0992513.1 beta-eliminating lyase-related protein [Nannocystis sp. ILAH1]